MIAHNGHALNIMNNNTRSSPQANSFTFQSSTVTYGGSNGAYYTNSMTKRTGSDGVSKNTCFFLNDTNIWWFVSLMTCYFGFQLRFEEYKEADSVTGQAAHRVSRGIHEKGHTVTRNLKSDGQVDTMQVLHNINEGIFCITIIIITTMHMYMKQRVLMCVCVR